MLSDEEKQTIDYLKARLYGNKGCKFIDVAQSDLRIFLKLVENLQKDIEIWKKYCNEQENDITLKNNKICDLEFKIEKQSKEIEELKDMNERQQYRIELVSEDEIEERGDSIDESTMLKQIKLKLQEKNIPIETLLAEFERLEDLEDDREMLKAELEKEKEKNKKAIDFINDENNFFEDGENWQNVLKIKEILEEE